MQSKGAGVNMPSVPDVHVTRCYMHTASVNVWWIFNNTDFTYTISFRFKDLCHWHNFETLMSFFKWWKWACLICNTCPSAGLKVLFFSPFTWKCVVNPHFLISDIIIIIIIHQNLFIYSMMDAMRKILEKTKILHHLFKQNASEAVVIKMVPKLWESRSSPSLSIPSLYFSCNDTYNADRNVSNGTSHSITVGVWLLVVMVWWCSSRVLPCTPDAISCNKDIFQSDVFLEVQAKCPWGCWRRNLTTLAIER